MKDKFEPDLIYEKNFDGERLAVRVSAPVFSDDDCFGIQYDFEILLNGAAATEPALHAALLRPVRTAALREAVAQVFENELEWSGFFDGSCIRVSFADPGEAEEKKRPLRFSCAVIGAEKCPYDEYMKIRGDIAETVWNWLGL